MVFTIFYFLFRPGEEDAGRGGHGGGGGMLALLLVLHVSCPVVPRIDFFCPLLPCIAHNNFFTMNINFNGIAQHCLVLHNVT